jgi:hypothetical protein
MFQTKVVEQIKTHILYSQFFSENRAVYEKDIKDVERGRPQMKMDHVRLNAGYLRLQTHPQCV